MNLVFITEARFVRKGVAYYSVDGVFSKGLWKRYLDVFDHVTIGARVFETQNLQEEERRVDSDKVSFIELPAYLGPLGFLKNALSIRSVLQKNIIKTNAHIFRVPGMLGTLAAKVARLKGIPYSLEVVGDPAEVFAKGSFNHPLRFFFRWLFTSLLRKIILASGNVLYVTESTLQSKYPVQSGALATSASNVFLDAQAYSSKAKSLVDSDQPIKLLSIGSLDQMYKAPDVLLKAVQKLKAQGCWVQLTWLGDGVFKSEMMALSAQLGLLDEVNFKGNLSNVGDVRKYLDQSDIFVLVSRTEGLPRAMLEAMARGLPCIGTQVGGIPEILESKVLVPKNDVDSLVRAILKMIKDVSFTNQQAERNLIEAKKYSSDRLDERRMVFYMNAIKITS